MPKARHSVKKSVTQPIKFLVKKSTPKKIKEAQIIQKNVRKSTTAPQKSGEQKIPEPAAEPPHKTIKRIVQQATTEPPHKTIKRYVEKATTEPPHKTVKRYVQEMAKIPASPHSIAIGVALGAFIGIMPTPGFGVLLGILFAFLFKQINRLALFGSMAFWNPLVAAPFNYVSLEVGNKLFATVPDVSVEVSAAYAVFHYTWRFLVGSLIVAGGMAILLYIISYTTTWYVQRRRKQVSQTNAV